MGEGNNSNILNVFNILDIFSYSEYFIGQVGEGKGNKNDVFFCCCHGSGEIFGKIKQNRNQIEEKNNICRNHKNNTSFRYNLMTHTIRKLFL